MRKLTFAALSLAIVWATPLAAADIDRSEDVAALAKASPTLADAAAAAPTQADGVAAIRDAARPKLGRLSDGEVVVALIALSDALGGVDRYTDALRLGEHAANLSRSANLGPGLLFDSLTRTGSMRYMLDDYDGASRDLDAARRAAADIEPFDANSVANATSNFAVTLDQAGRYREAEAAFNEAIALRAQATEQRPASIAVAWLALAAVHKRMGRHDLSEQEYRTALKLLEGAGQTQSPTYAGALHNYGVLMGETGRDEEAAALYRRAIESRPADVRLMPSMVNNYTSLAAALMGLGRLEEAGAAIQNAQMAAGAKAKADTASINVLSARAQLAAREGDGPAAEAHAAQSVALAREFLAPDSIRLADALVALSGTLLANGKTAEAKAAADEAVAIGVAVPDRNPLKAITHDVRAAALAKAGDSQQALAASRIAAEIQGRRFSEESGRTPTPLQAEERDIAARRLSLIWSTSHR